MTAEMLRCTREGRGMETCWLKEFDELEACNWLRKKTQEELREIHGIEERVEILDQLSGKLITFGKCDCYGTSSAYDTPGVVDWKSGNEGGPTKLCLARSIRIVTNCSSSIPGVLGSFGYRSARKCSLDFSD
jgi:hypothetical protein